MLKFLCVQAQSLSLYYSMNCGQDDARTEGGGDAGVWAQKQVIDNTVLVLISCMNLTVTRKEGVKEIPKFCRRHRWMVPCKS